MFKKLAVSTRFLLLPLFVLFPFFWNPNEINLNAATANEVVTRTGFSLPAQLPVQITLPDPTLAFPQPTPTQIPPSYLQTASIDSYAFQKFIESVVDGQSGVLRGVYVKDVLALKVIQQPTKEPLFVSKEPGIATQFHSAAKNGVTGILAHNYLSGALFFQLELGQQVQLVYGDGKVARYTITDIQRFQKLQLSSPQSEYIDLSAGEKLSTQKVFDRFYSGKDHVTFQTCIRKGEEWSWGLIFVVATPTE